MTEETGSVAVEQEADRNTDKNSDEEALPFATSHLIDTSSPKWPKTPLRAAIADLDRRDQAPEQARAGARIPS